MITAGTVLNLVWRLFVGLLNPFHNRFPSLAGLVAREGKDLRTKVWDLASMD